MVKYKKSRGQRFYLMKEDRSALGRGLLITLCVILVSRVFSVAYSEVGEDSGAASNILYIIVFLLDGVVYACGAATVIHFVGNSRMTRNAILSVIALTALDYASAAAIDLSLGNIDASGIGYLILYLLANLIARALAYGLTAVFAGIFTRTLKNSTPAPLFGLRHAVPVKMLTAAVIRFLPYIINELYANISGIIKYGTSLTSAQIMSILGSYGEILADALIVYFSVYVVLAAVRGKAES